MKNYKQILREIREDKDLNQSQVAQILQISQSVYSKYERGTIKMPIEDLQILCRYYNISADYILGFTDEPKPLPKK